MTTRNYIKVGLKLLGIYFAVLAVNLFFTAMVNGSSLLMMGFVRRHVADNPYDAASFSFINAAKPLAYAVCSFILIRRTDWCLRFVTGRDEDR